MKFSASYSIKFDGEVLTEKEIHTACTNYKSKVRKTEKKLETK